MSRILSNDMQSIGFGIMIPALFHLKLYVIKLEVCNAPKPPLCKGRWAASRRFGGIAELKISNFHNKQAKL